MSNIHDRVQTFNNSVYGVDQPNITSPHRLQKLLAEYGGSSQTLTNASFYRKTNRNWENSAMMLRNETKQNIKEKETNQNTPEEMV